MLNKEYKLLIKQELLNYNMDVLDKVSGNLTNTEKDLVIVPDNYVINSIGLNIPEFTYYISRYSGEIFFNDISPKPYFDYDINDLIQTLDTNFNLFPYKHLLEKAVNEDGMFKFKHLGHLTNSFYFQVINGVITNIPDTFTKDLVNGIIYGSNTNNELYAIYNIKKLTYKKMGLNKVEDLPNGFIKTNFKFSENKLKINKNANTYELILNEDCICKIIGGTLNIDNIRYQENSYTYLNKGLYLIDRVDNISHIVEDIYENNSAIVNQLDFENIIENKTVEYMNVENKIIFVENISNHIGMEIYFLKDMKVTATKLIYLFT